MCAHTYERTVDPESGDSLALIAARIAPGSTVLELGLATGYFSRYLTEQKQCQVDGVELDEAMAEKARPWCRTLLVADLEQVRLDEHFPQGAYDYIICADVLEHLYKPDALLAQLKGLLKGDGRVIISIPNIAYGGLILDLIAGNFRYRDEGLLDRTHIRFYTRSGFLALMESLGYGVDDVEPVNMAFEDSEFYTRLEGLSVPLKNYLFSRPDAEAYQFIVVARPR